MFVAKLCLGVGSFGRHHVSYERRVCGSVALGVGAMIIILFIDIDCLVTFI